MRLRERVLPILQLTRAALVFTAVADSLCALMLQSRLRGLELDPLRIAMVVLISLGLYSLGMSLNDIIDRRRDSLIAAYRPLPSGRIDIGTAHFIAAAMAAMALIAGAVYSAVSPTGWRSLVLVIWCGLLISFYDFAGKYLVAPGLLTLGLIRFFHAAIPAPGLPNVWQPLVLLNHVTILSMVAYVWEEKRPALTAMHVRFVLAGLALVDLLVISAVYARRELDGPFLEVMWVTPGLLAPLGSAAVFAGLALLIKRTSKSPREAGQKVMLYGLLWLIVYDALFLAGYGAPWEALIVALLLPVAYLSVRVMRWWSKLTAMTQRPEFRRV